MKRAAFEGMLEQFVRLAADEHQREREAGQANTAGKKRAARDAEIARLASALRELLEQPTEAQLHHAELWPADDYVTDVEALRRLAYAALRAAEASRNYAPRATRNALRHLVARALAAAKRCGLPRPTAYDADPFVVDVHAAAQAARIYVDVGTVRKQVAAALPAIWGDK